MFSRHTLWTADTNEHVHNKVIQVAESVISFLHQQCINSTFAWTQRRTPKRDQKYKNVLSLHLVESQNETKRLLIGYKRNFGPFLPHLNAKGASHGPFRTRAALFLPLVSIKYTKPTLVSLFLLWSNCCGQVAPIVILCPRLSDTNLHHLTYHLGTLAVGEFWAWNQTLASESDFVWQTEHEFRDPVCVMVSSTTGLIWTISNIEGRIP